MTGPVPPTSTDEPTDCEFCSQSWRNGVRDNHGPAEFFWEHQGTHHISRLCNFCVTICRANGAAEPDIAPVRIWRIPGTQRIGASR